MKSLISKALLCTAFLTAAAFAAPIYRGSFTLPYPAQWGQATLPAGDYSIQFQDVGSRVFVAVNETRTGRKVALLPAKATEDAKGPSALLIVNRGNRHMISSLRLAELGEAFFYESTTARGEEQEVLRNQTLPVVAAKR